MLKMRGIFNGNEVLILGLSHGNLDRLRRDGLKGYIRIDGAEHDVSCDIIITAAESEAHMMEAFKDLIGPKTKVTVSPKLKGKSS